MRASAGRPRGRGAVARGIVAHCAVERGDDERGAGEHGACRPVSTTRSSAVERDAGCHLGTAVRGGWRVRAGHGLAARRNASAWRHGLRRGASGCLQHDWAD